MDCSLFGRVLVFTNSAALGLEIEVCLPLAALIIGRGRSANIDVTCECKVIIECLGFKLTELL